METTLSERLSLLLKTIHMTEIELAGKINKSPSTVYRILNNESSSTNATLKAIANATGCEFKWLSLGIGEMQIKNKGLSDASVNPWKDEAYTNVLESYNNAKNQLEYWQRKYDQLFDAVVSGKLGKLLALKFASEFGVEVEEALAA